MPAGLNAGAGSWRAPVFPATNPSVGGSWEDPGNSRERSIVVEVVESSGTQRLEAMAIYQQIWKYSII